MSQTIPTLAEPYYTIRVRLDDRDYTLEFIYSPRQERYYLSVSDSEDVPLVCGLKLVSNTRLLRYWHHKEGVPPGELMVTATGADQSSPRIGELLEDGRCQLTYFTAAEVQATSFEVPFMTFSGGATYAGPGPSGETLTDGGAALTDGGAVLTH